MKPVEVSVRALRKLYETRKNDEDILEIDGLQFVPTYLKYLLQYLKDKPETVLFTPNKGGKHE